MAGRLDQLPVEEVVYLDHVKWADHRAWESADKMLLSPTFILTYGIVIEENERWLNIASTVAAAAGKVAGVVCIVKGAIISRTVIKPGTE
jgi:hypothetical protein